MLAELQSDVCSIATGGFEYSSDHYELTMQALAADGLAAQKIIQAAIDSLDSGKIIEIEN